MAENRKRKAIKPIELAIPSEVPVFPLPNVILFPEAEVPLFIFEPRYRQMLDDIRKGHKMMAISLYKDGWEAMAEPIPSHDIVGVGYIRMAIDYPDGTSHIVLKGIGRAQILNYSKMSPYRIARVKKIPDHVVNKRELLRLCVQLKKLFIQRLRWESENPSLVPKLPRHFNNPITLSHLASCLIRVNPYLKQNLLETTNSNSRVKHLIELLKEEIIPYGSQN